MEILVSALQCKVGIDRLCMNCSGIIRLTKAAWQEIFDLHIEKVIRSCYLREEGSHKSQWGSELEA